MVISLLLLVCCCMGSVTGTCVGHSRNLDPQQCAAWQTFFDGSTGVAWRPIKNCTTSTTNNRDDPCICSKNVVCEGTDITEIILPAQGLSNVIADSLRKLTGLKRLDLSDNYRLGGQFPDFLESLPNLTYLDLSHCKLRGQVRAWDFSHYTYCSIGGKSNRYCDPVPKEVISGCNKTAIDTGLFPCNNELATVVPAKTV